MKPFELLAETLSPDGTLIKLTRRGDEYFILADGLTLMSNRAHNSEDALARLPSTGPVHSITPVFSLEAWAWVSRCAPPLIFFHRLRTWSSQS